MIIYFIQVENDGAVKIGQTRNIEDRLTVLQTAHHKKLNVLFQFDVEDEKADYAEKHLHKVFHENQIRGEWFSPCPFMYDFIARIGKDGFWVNAIDEYEEFLRNDPFSATYNQVYGVIKKAREYGDYRYLRSIAHDLEELKKFVFTGRTS